VTRPAFAHASEEELARILDYYQVRWEYEPRRFPILWNLDGKVVESFSPDFYLPDLDLFLELTTLKQSLVRRKNRKLRRLRELYPDIRIKLLYGKDFKALMLKYGRIDVAASLTGPEGQARVNRAVEAATQPDEIGRPDLTPGETDSTASVGSRTPGVRTYSTGGGRATRRRKERADARATPVGDGGSP
jgi:hypothetical protein